MGWSSWEASLEEASLDLSIKGENFVGWRYRERVFQREGVGGDMVHPCLSG